MVTVDTEPGTLTLASNWPGRWETITREMRIRELHVRRRRLISLLPCEEHGSLEGAESDLMLLVSTFLNCPGCDPEVEDVCSYCTGQSREHSGNARWPCRTIELLDGIVPVDEAKRITCAHQAGDHSECPMDCPEQQKSYEAALDSGMEA
jgi:hypothetical protein